jgi:YHS domain-containing protein
MTSALRRLAVLSALAAPLFAAQLASAGEAYVDSTRFAVSGYDVVAYFDRAADQGGVKGSRAYTAIHNGATYAFASAANRDRFLAEPGRYLPQFDGHCAWAAGQGYKAPGSPTVWRVVDGKLYLNYSREVGRRWANNTPAQIKAGQANWQKLDAAPAARGDAADYDPKASPTP